MNVRILRIISRLNIGGPAIHVHLLTQGVDRRRYESVLVTGRISANEGDMGYLFGPSDIAPIVIPSLQREIEPGADGRTVMAVFRLLRKLRPDIVHTHMAKAGFVGRIPAWIYSVFSGRKIRTVHTFHGHVFEGYFGATKSRLFVLIERFLGRFTDVIIALSESQRRDLSEKYRIAPPHKIRTIPLGFDLGPLLNNGRPRGAFRRRLGLGEEKVLVGIIGRLVPVKNHALFLEAARIVLNTHPALAATFVVVGDGELRHGLETQARENGISEQIAFSGWQRDLESIYRDLDILALTSLNEGTPVALIEAMASGVPVVATDVGGVPDVLGASERRPVADGVFLCPRGVLCRQGDSRAVAAGIRYAIEHGNNEISACIARGRSFVSSVYSKERLLRDMAGLYDELVGRP